jgi:hypothetical protein
MRLTHSLIMHIRCTRSYDDERLPRILFLVYGYLKIRYNLGIIDSYSYME